jgi:hypothetical protein
VEESEQEGDPLLVSMPVLCEVVWVLSSTYGLPKSTIVEILAQVLDTGCFRIEGEALVWRALRLYREGKGGFADYLIGEIGPPRRLPRHRHLRPSSEGCPGLHSAGLSLTKYPYLPRSLSTRATISG